MDYFFHTPSKNHGCFYPVEKGLFLPMDFFPSYLRRNDGCFYPPEKVLFLPMDYFLHYLVETMVVFIHRRKGFLPLDFLHYQ
jgi:hypothetical protein